MIKNTLYFIGSVLLFFTSMILYGIILNASEDTLEETLSKKNKSAINEPRIVIEKSSNQLILYDSDESVKTYKAVFGRTRNNQKMNGLKSYTPVGNYKVCSIDTNYVYHKMIRINYPNEMDAAEALKNGLISQSEYARIVEENLKYGCTKTANYFGNEIGIHGIGEYDLVFRNLPFVFNWTNGSIALSNEGIDELYSVVKIGTSVQIID